MTYEAPTAEEFRSQVGTKSEKITDELALIATDLNRNIKTAKVALAPGSADDIAAAWQNPESSPILVEKVLLDITTAGGTATAVLNAGSAADPVTGSDNLIDGADANAAALYDNRDDQGTNGTSKQKLDENGGSTDHITAQIKVANAAALAGYLYVHYTIVGA